MMRAHEPSDRWLALLVVAAWLSLAPAARAQPVTLVPVLPAGHAFSLSMTKTREHIEGEKSLVRTRAETSIDVVVREATAEGWLIDWTFGETRVVEPANLAPPPDAALFDGLTLRLLLDKEGRPRSIENYADVLHRIDEATHELLQRIPDAGARDRLAVLMREAFASQEQIERLLIGDIADYFRPFSAPLDWTQPTNRDVHVPSPVSSKPLRAVDEFTLTRFQPRAGDTTAPLASIEWRRTLDPDATSRMTHDMEERVRERARTQPEASVLPVAKSIELRIDGRYEIPLDGDQLPITAEVLRRWSSDGSILSDDLRFVRTR